MTVVRLEPRSFVGEGWTPIGSKNRWEEVAQEALQDSKRLKEGTAEEEAQTLKAPSEAEQAARGDHNSVKGNGLFISFKADAEAKIPAGATINRIVVHYYLKPSSTSLLIGFEAGGAGHEASQSQTPSSVLAEWRRMAITEANVAKLNRQSFVEKLSVFFTNEKATEARLNVVYVEVEYTAASHEHTLTVAQPQTAARTIQPRRAVAAAQTQATQKTASPARALATAQAQTTQRTVSVLWSLTASQPQAPGLLRTVARVFSVSQPQTAARTTVVARTLRAAAPQATAVLRALARTLTVAQAQVVSRVAVVARALAASQPQAAQRSVTIGRTLNAPQAQSVTVGRAVARTLRATQPQTVTLTRSSLRVTLTAAQPQATDVRRGVLRTFNTSQAQTATIVFTGKQVPVLVTVRSYPATVVTVTSYPSTVVYVRSYPATIVNV